MAATSAVYACRLCWAKVAVTNLTALFTPFATSKKLLTKIKQSVGGHNRLQWWTSNALPMHIWRQCRRRFHTSHITRTWAIIQYFDGIPSKFSACVDSGNQALFLLCQVKEPGYEASAYQPVKSIGRARNYIGTQWDRNTTYKSGTTPSAYPLSTLAQ